VEKEHSKIVATIEARMTFSRLPVKVILPANGKPMLEHMVGRLKQDSRKLR
jgi:spore coat polysaccharide biosynthesis protein SpsF